MSKLHDQVSEQYQVMLPDQDLEHFQVTMQDQVSDHLQDLTPYHEMSLYHQNMHDRMKWDDQDLMLDQVFYQD